MYGDNDADVMRGGAADDLIRGGSGDDEIEGNGNSSQALPLDEQLNPLAAVNANLDLTEGAGNEWTQSGGGDGDVIYGDADQDDIVGGSQGTPAEADGGDTILGNAAQDVILGDDGEISRPGGNDADGTKTRAVTLRNPGTDGGADYIQGNEENDDVYAGGAGDLVHGDVGDDYVEGNGGADGDPGTIPVAAIGLYGDTGQDDLIGGTSQGTGGVADGADDIWGGQGADVATGDNADVTRATGSDCPAEPNASAGYDCNTFRLDAADVVIRRIQLSDVATTGARCAGGLGRRRHDRRPGRPRPPLRPGRRRLDRGRRQRRLRLRQRRRRHDLRRRRPGRPRRRHRPDRLRRAGDGHRRPPRRGRHHPRRRRLRRDRGRQLADRPTDTRRRHERRHR